MTTDRIALTNFIKGTKPIPDNILRDIVAVFEHVSLAKGDYIVKERKVCDSYVFIEAGYARAFTHDTDGNEVTTWFYTPNSVAFEVASFFKRAPANENIQTLTDCTGWKLTFDQLNHLFHAIPEFREFGRMLLVNGFVQLKERMLSMINNTAEQRYEHLLATKPDIFQQAPLKTIASYLGITDTSLSRIRKEMARK